MSKLEKCAQRLAEIAELIEAVENRCMAADGPVTPTTKEITEAELRTIYRLAAGKGRDQLRKARRPGRVLARVYVNLDGDCLCHLGRYRQCTCRTADCRRVEVRAKEGGK
ncbi:MAG: hypothetical protein WC789_09475 [Lentisphaeria bacterium]